MKEPYELAQKGISELKSAIYMLLSRDNMSGMSNAQIGRMLGIYMGHVGHEGHISRTLLAIMESEGLVEQDKSSKLWRIRKHYSSSGDMD